MDYHSDPTKPTAFMEGLWWADIVLNMLHGVIYFRNPMKLTEMSQGHS